MATFYFVRTDEMFGLFGSVSGSVDTSYDASWLVDGRPGRPVRKTGGFSGTISGSSATVSLVACCNHNVSPGGSISVSGGVSATLTVPAAVGDDIPLNPWAAMSETSVSSLSISTSGSVIGEFVAGRRRTLGTLPHELQLAIRPTFGGGRYGTVAHDAEFDSMMPYDLGYAARTLEGEAVVSDSSVAVIEAWYNSTRGNTRPTLIVPRSDVQDAWLVRFVKFDWQPAKAGINYVSMGFEEYPRSRW